MNEEAARGLYIHVPFCRHFCSYCHFPRLRPDPVRMAAYRDLVLEELRLRGPFPGRVWDSLFLGGGTPSLMPDEVLSSWAEAVRRGLTWMPGAEWTLEANPEDVSPVRLRRWRSMGFNRLSLGIQSLDDRSLASLGRNHGAGQAILAVGLARAEGWPSVSADLLLGIGGQTPEGLEGHIRLLVEAGITHLSLYLLEQRGEIVAVDEDAREEALAALYEAGMATAGVLGMVPYETSNMSFPGYACRHNLHYWRGDAYLGLGLAAASWWEGSDRRNPGHWHGWAGPLERGHLPRQHREVWEPEWRRLVTGLRLSEGLDETVAVRSRAHILELVEDGFLWHRAGRFGLRPEHSLKLHGVLERLEEAFDSVRQAPEAGCSSPPPPESGRT